MGDFYQQAEAMRVILTSQIEKLTAENDALKKENQQLQADVETLNNMIEVMRIHESREQDKWLPFY